MDPSPADVRLIGQSPAIRAMEDDIDRAARSDAKVLITGETGVGKEVVARLIHRRSARARAPIVTVNCAGMPDGLLESELFGHTRGSFTGAYRDKAGLVEMASNGTLFLDEVGEMTARLQAVLLRFVESGEIQPVGADTVRRVVNVRIVAATHRDLPAQIVAGAFREDLYFRLNVIELAMPPLRERREDVALLLQNFLRTYGRAQGIHELEVTAAAMAALEAYHWPGNVRELKNVAERISVRATGSLIQLAHLPAEITRSGVVPLVSGPASAECAPAGPVTSDAHVLATSMEHGGESFWSAVHPQFMSRDLTRVELRNLIHVGLTRTGGNYRDLIDLFNMPRADYTRFMRFLHAHQCHLPSQRFRRDAPDVLTTSGVLQ